MTNVAVSMIALCVPAAAAAGAGGVALVVGSNAGGPGQSDLAYAEDDAQRVAEVLGELGGYAREDVRTVVGPDRAGLVAAIETLRAPLEARAARGEESVLFFYYSGHARSSALSLGREELGLDELRARLTSLPTTLTLVVLDACQSGAFSGIKGAEPAGDFSFNSVRGLDTSGLVVMASSTATELSQESEALGASYFTHHLLVGLRGAADADTDGRVTLDEAYRYAYQSTLATTAATSVGRQHVTLETDLRGKGDLVLTYPEELSSGLALAADLAGHLLVQREPRGTVVAELHKAAGGAVRLALAPGVYAITHRDGEDARRCEVELAADRTESFDRGHGRCVALEVLATADKGLVEPGVSLTWGIELGLGIARPSTDLYDQRLEDFGFGATGFAMQARWSVAITVTAGRYFSLVLDVGNLGERGYERRITDVSDASDPSGPERLQSFGWETYALGLGLRAGYPFFDGALTPYAQLGGGPAFARSVFHDEVEPDSADIEELHVGYHLDVAGGLQWMPWRHLGLFGLIGYSYAPALTNEIGDQHDNGAAYLVGGLRGAY